MNNKWEENKNTKPKKNNKKPKENGQENTMNEIKKELIEKQLKDIEKNPNRFYVYVYLDPRKPGKYTYGEYSFEYEPFYVGRGQTHRIDQHINESKVRNTHKNNKIKKILKENLEPIRIKLFENLTNEEADNIEIEIIKIIGRFDLELGPLTNKTNGGITNTGRIITDETRSKMSLTQKGKKVPKSRIEKQSKTMLGVKQMKSGRATSKYVGVHYVKRHNRWEANIGYNKKTIYIGKFNSEYEAGIAYNKKVLVLYGEDGKFNEIEGWRNYIFKNKWTSEYIGVSFHKKTNKWRTIVERKHIATFSTETDAAKAYNVKMFEIYGLNAKLNDVEGWENFILKTKKQKRSNFRGISYEKDSKKWRVTVTYNHVKYQVGRFKNEIDAAMAYNIKTYEIRGEKAILNDVNGWEKFIIPSKNKTSIYLGIYFSKERKKWYSSVSVNRKGKFIGTFNGELEAAQAYNEYIIKNNLPNKLNII